MVFLYLAVLHHSVGVTEAWLLQGKPRRQPRSAEHEQQTLLSPATCTPNSLLAKELVSLINVTSHREEKQNTCDHLMCLPVCGLFSSNAQAGFSFVAPVAGLHLPASYQYCHHGRASLGSVLIGQCCVNYFDDHP